MLSKEQKNNNQQKIREDAKSLGKDISKLGSDFSRPRDKPSQSWLSWAGGVATSVKDGINVAAIKCVEGIESVKKGTMDLASKSVQTTKQAASGVKTMAANTTTTLKNGLSHTVDKAKNAASHLKDETLNKAAAVKGKVSNLAGDLKEKVHHATELAQETIQDKLPKSEPLVRGAPSDQKQSVKQKVINKEGELSGAKKDQKLTQSSEPNKLPFSIQEKKDKTAQIKDVNGFPNSSSSTTNSQIPQRTFHHPLSKPQPVLPDGPLPTHIKIDFGSNLALSAEPETRSPDRAPPPNDLSPFDRSAAPVDASSPLVNHHNSDDLTLSEGSDSSPESSPIPPPPPPVLLRTSMKSSQSSKHPNEPVTPITALCEQLKLVEPYLNKPGPPQYSVTSPVSDSKSTPSSNANGMATLARSEGKSKPITPTNSDDTKQNPTPSEINPSKPGESDPASIESTGKPDSVVDKSGDKSVDKSAPVSDKSSPIPDKNVDKSLPTPPKPSPIPGESGDESAPVSDESPLIYGKSGEKSVPTSDKSSPMLGKSFGKSAPVSDKSVPASGQSAPGDKNVGGADDKPVADNNESAPTSDQPPGKSAPVGNNSIGKSVPSSVSPVPVSDSDSDSVSSAFAEDGPENVQSDPATKSGNKTAHANGPSMMDNDASTVASFTGSDTLAEQDGYPVEPHYNVSSYLGRITIGLADTIKSASDTLSHRTG